MSKRDKSGAEEIGREASPAMPDHPHAAPSASSAPLQMGEPMREKTGSRRFNDWLDRALPLLQERLGDLGTVSVTAQTGKTRH